MERTEPIKDRIYLLRFEVGGKLLTYTGKIIGVDETFISFEDKFGKEITYKLSTLISFQEVDNGR